MSNNVAGQPQNVCTEARPRQNKYVPQLQSSPYMYMYDTAALLMPRVLHMTERPLEAHTITQHTSQMGVA